MLRLIQRSLSDPVTCFWSSAAYAIFWITIGYTIYPSKEPDIENYMSWSKSYSAHWVVASSFGSSILLYISHRRLIFHIDWIEEGSKVKNEIKRIADKLFILVFIFGFQALIIVTFLNVYNASYASDNVSYSRIVSNEIFLNPWLFPLITGALYYMGVVFPLFVSFSMYIISLNVLASNCIDLKFFNHLHRDRVCGLSGLGNSIFWHVFCLLLFLIPPTFIQMYYFAELTPPNFIALIGVLIMIGMAGVYPLWKIHLQLVQVKTHESIKIKESIDSMEDELSKSNSKYRFELLKTQLDDLRKTEDFIHALRVIPISRSSSVVGVVLILASTILSTIRIIQSWIDVSK